MHILRTLSLTLALAAIAAPVVAPVALAAGGDGAVHPHYTVDDDGDGVPNWRDADSKYYVVTPVLFHAINFSLLVGAIWFFAGASIKDAVRARAIIMRSEIDEAAKIKAAAQARHAEIAARMDGLSAEVAALKAKAEADAKSEEAAIARRGEEAAERIAATATRQINDEAARARFALRREAVDLAVSLAEGILKQQVAPADQRRLAEELLSTLSEVRHG